MRDRSHPSAVDRRSAGSGATVRVRLTDLWELTKPGITGLVLTTAAVGFYLGSRGSIDWLTLLSTMVGTSLLAGGTNALNQYAERDADARMQRTRGRPLPSGRLAPDRALAFAVAISVAGALILALTVNALTALLGIAALALYIFVYTPLKTETWLCTVVGAVPGAIPPLMGWAAARGELDPASWVLFGIVFLWQLPHFFAIAWLYREDYARAGFPMLAVIDPAGTRTARQVLLALVALVPVSLLTTMLGLTGAVYLVGALTLGLGLMALGVRLAVARSGRDARRLFLGSVVYLPVLLVLMVVDKL